MGRVRIHFRATYQPGVYISEKGDNMLVKLNTQKLPTTTTIGIFIAMLTIRCQTVDDHHVLLENQKWIHGSEDCSTNATIDPSSSGELWERFAKINSEMRRANDKFLQELNAKSNPTRLWKGSFQLLPKATNEARFADHRTYLYQGRELNREWHLGVDLASVKNAPLPAGNSGIVVFAGLLGIYGNCVVIDHGMGIQSVYGHLEKIDVREGQKVERGQTLGNTGMTGLAGGDHAHIGLQLHGVFVDPVEWSLPKWIDKTLMPLVSQIEWR